MLKTNARLLLGCAAVLCWTPHSARADYNAGDPCDTKGAFHTKNDADKAQHLLCAEIIHGIKNWVYTASFRLGKAGGLVGVVGANAYCDPSGIHCFNPASGGSSLIAPGSDQQILFNDSGALNAATGFVFNSATGNVGIGTASPQAMLHVNAASAGAKGSIIRGYASQTANLTEWQDSSSNVMSFVASSGALNTVDAAYSAGWDGSTEAPTKNAVYDKIEAVASSGATAAGPVGAIQFNASSSLAGSSNFVYSNATGRLGLGTNSPAEMLNLNGNGVNLKFSGTVNNSGTHGIVFVHSIVPSANPTTGIFGVPSGVMSLGTLVFSVASANTSPVNSTTDAMLKITDSSVNVLNGKSNDAFLTVGPSMNINTGDRGVLFDMGGATSSGVISKSYGSYSDTSYIGLAIDNAAQPDSNDAGLILNSSGKVGIGTLSPGAVLEVNAYSAGASSKGLIVKAAISQTANLFETQNSGGTPVFVVASAGNVAIGKSAPAAALDVVGDIYYTGAVIDVSDRRLKENIAPLTEQLPKITALKGVSFSMKEDDKTELGFIAQDVEALYPELVRTNADGMKTLNYFGFIAPLVEAVKEQQRQIDLLRAENRSLSEELNSVKTRIRLQNQGDQQ